MIAATKTLGQKPNETLACSVNELLKQNRNRRKRQEWLKKSSLMNSTSSCALRVKRKKKTWRTLRPSSRLRGLISGVNRFLKEGKYPVSSVDDKKFNQPKHVYNPDVNNLKNKAKEENQTHLKRLLKNR